MYSPALVDVQWNAKDALDWSPPPPPLHYRNGFDLTLQFGLYIMPLGLQFINFSLSVLQIHQNTARKKRC